MNCGAKGMAAHPGIWVTLAALWFHLASEVQEGIV